MRRIFQEDRRIVEGRFLWANILFLLITGFLLIRLWWVQIYKGDYYRQIAENNRIQYIEIPAPRGIIYDKSGQVVLGNRPYFDLVYIPQFVHDRETTFKILGRLLHMPVGVFERRLWMSRGQPKYLPVNLKRNLTLHEVATIQSNKIFLPGIDIAVAPRRDYKPETPSHMVGYLGEISKTELEKHKKGDGEDPDYPYRAGDLVGKQGLEWRWEKYLRGNRGHRLIQVDAFGRQVDPSAEGPISAQPPVAATPGADLILTIDMELQRVAKEAFRGKNGAVVVLNPQNGEVLAMVSEPGYDPNVYQGGLTEEKYRSLIANPFKPFLDKTTGGVFVPGSTYKAVVAIAGLEEGLINANTTFFCPGHYTLGDKTYKCMHAHGTMNLHNALMKSCDVYFYNVGVALGVDRIAKYAEMLGLGQRTGFLLNFEQPGLVPTTAWKKLTFRVPWSTGETPNVAIGQGQDGVTPLQLANLYAAIGNGGNVWRPYVVKRVINPVGETLLAQEPELIRKLDKIKPGTWKLVKEGLQAVVMDKDGTGKAAAVPGYTVAGKTGSAQVVSLAKNSGKTQRDVSIAWREHALFAAFSPVDKPEIAVAIVSEHDKQSGGGRSAAPVAGRIIKAYWDLKKQRAVALGIKDLGKTPTVTAP
jgi:penicillin-binding protein 2